MLIFNVNSVNEALYRGLHALARFGIQEGTRNGPVVVAPGPIMTNYNMPRNRVLVNAKRDANPFFHLFEALWMLAGRNDLAFPQKFVSTFGQFSDDGETLHGAYGYRWRKWFGYDQLSVIIEQLRHDSTTRRAVLAMWDASLNSDDSDMVFGDLEFAARGGKDVPCNTHAYFDTIGGRLNMTVMCRSNDLILGACGANAVHFSFLLEYMVLMTGLPMGIYRQFSNNYHAYLDLYPTILADRVDMLDLAEDVYKSCPYSRATGMSVRDYPAGMIGSPVLFRADEQQCFHEDLDAFMEFDIDDLTTYFFMHVVAPMYRVWSAWKAKDFDEAKHLCLTIRADDWRTAAQSWLSIRELRRGEDK